MTGESVFETRQGVIRNTEYVSRPPYTVSSTKVADVGLTQPQMGMGNRWPI